MSTEPKVMNPKELQDEGYLAEVNRCFFHPLGLALAVQEHPEDIFTIMVLDDREDLEGWHFSDDSLPEVAIKAEKVREERVRRHPHRMTALGYWTQPVGVTTR